MLATRETIMELIPQRPPMVMIQNLLHADEAGATTELVVEPSNLFVDDGFLSEGGIVENIAQTAAAQVGFLSRAKGSAVPLGFIAAIKNLEIFSLPALHAKIITTVRITDRVLDVTLVEGEVRQGKDIHCVCELRIFIKQQTHMG